MKNCGTKKSTYILYKITSFLSLWWSMRHNLGEAFLSHPLLKQVFSTLSCRGVEKWHLLSLRAQRPKIKLLELGPLCCIYRNQLEDKWRDSYSTGCHERPCTHTTVHTRLYSDAPLLYMQARYTQMYAHSAGRKPHYMVGLNKHFAGENIKASIFISGWKIADITSKEELILNQFFRLNLFALRIFNGNLIFDYIWHCFSHFTFSLISIILNCQRGNR